MLGRGLKRKLNDHDETMTDFSCAYDCPRTMPYSHQRQLVLNMCLNKLQSYKMLAEPNLHRSVLIANTVRQIQEETRQEASQLPGVMGGDLPANMYPGSDSLDTSLNLPFGIDADFTRDSWPNENPLDSLMEVTDNDMSSAISSILKDLDFVEDISPSAAQSPAVDEPPKPMESGSKGEKQDLRGTECVFGSFELTSSTSYLKDLSVDDIFDDIDTSMYDSDFSFSSLMSPRMQPTVEEPLKLYTMCNNSSNSNLQVCRTDLNDLDHIMEILVGS
ncbi:SERTA domain-containing protein 2-like [Bufo gargarizans]|uniref:SERTA domain-containing protein 2-like n=1 Tax=Bufo gargarizans TaxID=30331 RepID=UPI001CF36EA3|nr:SERTA domain-containing protein 2-like [Bufo gargarizans]